jgi:hypothetical protein
MTVIIMPRDYDDWRLIAALPIPSSRMREGDAVVT